MRKPKYQIQAHVIQGKHMLYNWPQFKASGQKVQVFQSFAPTLAGLTTVTVEITEKRQKPFPTVGFTTDVYLLNFSKKIVP